jgi:serine/threonine-protein kinase
MAPERFGKAEITQRVDIYALACVLHECLTGSPPYRADTLSELVSAHLMEPVPRPSVSRPDVPADFDAVIACGMAKSPDERYSSAGDLARDAHQALSATGQLLVTNIVDNSQARTLQDTPIPPSPRLKSTKRRLLLVGAALAAVVAVVVAVVFVWPLRTRPPTIPTVSPDRLDSVLLGTDEINTLMHASKMQSSQAVRVVETGKGTLSDQDCLGALYPVQDKAYAGSGYLAVNDRALAEPPGDNNHHYVAEAAVAFPSADQARAFVKSSAGKWKFCPGRTLDATNTNSGPTTNTAPGSTPNGDTFRWAFGKLTGDPPKIALLTTQERTNGWTCQHVLSAVSNVVLDVDACAYSITNEGSQIADKIAAAITQ